jgi:hypothetical protein
VSTTRSGDASLQPPAYSSLPSIADRKIPDKISLRGAALPDPDHPFLISPLPQFTTPLTISDNFSFTPVPPLPELTDDLEDSSEVAESEDEATTPIVIQQDLQGSNRSNREPIFQQLPFRRTDGRSEHDFALSRSGPYLDHGRARSGSMPTSRSSPLSVIRSADTSDTSPPSPPKSATLSQYRQVPRESDVPSPTRSTLPQNPDGGVLRTRLHDLLRDSAMSSSLPNLSASHFPPSITNREASSNRASPSPSCSDSSNSNKTPVLSSSSDIAVPLPQSGVGKLLAGVAPNIHSAPRQGFSSASTEAKKLEEERRRKLREEKQNSRLERSANDMDREFHLSKQPSTSTSTQTSNTIQPTPRREQLSTTTTPVMISNSGPTSSSWRGQSSTTGTLGRLGSSVTPSQEEHDPFTHQGRYGSLGKARGAAFFSSVDPAGIHA